MTAVALTPTGRAALLHLAANAEADRRTHISAVHHSTRRGLERAGLVERDPYLGGICRLYLRLTPKGADVVRELAA